MYSDVQHYPVEIAPAMGINYFLAGGEDPGRILAV
jgi:hypothetical protein